MNKKVKIEVVTRGYIKDLAFSQPIQYYGYQDKDNFIKYYKKFVEVLNRITNAKT